jgi:hypothetical protein
MPRRSKLPKPIAGEPYRFHCPSDTLGLPPYLVDLEAHGGMAGCVCADYEKVKNPNRRRGGRSLRESTCKHIVRSYLYWAKQELKDRLGKHHALFQPSEMALVAWARREIQRRVREKRRVNGGRKEDE